MNQRRSIAPKERKHNFSRRNGEEVGLCVYLHLRKKRVFYVGQGPASRAFSTNGRSAEWYRACPDFKFNVRIHARGLSKSQADDLEESLFLKHSGKSKLVNRPIIAPGRNSLELWSWKLGVQCSKISGRTISIPWMMLDSYSSPEEPFRGQITVGGKTKRFFAKTLGILFHDFGRFALYPIEAHGIFSLRNRRHLAEFLKSYQQWIRVGSKAFLRVAAHPKRYRETLDFYIEATRYRGLSKLQASREYHADCTMDETIRKKHLANIAALSARFEEAFGQTTNISSPNIRGKVARPAHE